MKLHKSSLLQTDPGGATAVHSGPVPPGPTTDTTGVHTGGYQGDTYYDPYSQNHYPDNVHYQSSHTGVHTGWGENHNYYHNNYYYNEHNYHNQFYQGYSQEYQNPEVPNQDRIYLRMSKISYRIHRFPELVNFSN